MKKKMFSGFGNIQSRFWVVCLLNSIVSLLILSAVFLFSSYRMIVDRTTEEVSVNLEMASNLLDIQALEMETLARDILNNSVIYNSLTKQLSEERSGYPNTRVAQNISNELKKLCINNSDITTIYLFNWDGFEYCFQRSGQYTLVSFDFQENFDQLWYTRTMAAKGYEQYFLTDVTRPQSADSGVYSVSISKLLLDLTTNDPIGFLVINVNKGHYSNVFPSISEKEVGYAIADPEMGTVNYIASSPEMTEEIRETVLEEMNGETKNNSEYIVTSEQNKRTGWSLYHIAQKKHYIESLHLVLIWMLIGLVSVCGFSFFLSRFASRKITRPLQQLSYAIQEVHDTGAPPKDVVFENDEVGSIGQQFLALFKQNEELAEEVTAISVLQKEAELKELQAQINPHFLYNSLATIYWLAKSGRSEDAAQMSITLSELFKAMVNRHEDDFVTVADELHYIDQYLYIQNVRYKGSIQVSQNIDPRILQEKMLKLILQPLVENAVYHGLEPKKGDWYLDITGVREQEYIIFTIRDNGVGMDVELATKQGYALRNVMRRIQLRYGEPCGCKIVSQIGQGTTVTVKIRIGENKL